MPHPTLETDRFLPEAGTRVIVQVPEGDAARVIAAVLEVDPLIYGDYDRVTFAGAPGLQQFRALGGGRNPATGETVGVPCVELGFFLGEDGPLAAVLKAVYHAHPYEEPVIFAQPVLRMCHVRGMDEGNPNRFWNRETPDWVPDAHR